jgi:hypothetical protein
MDISVSLGLTGVSLRSASFRGRNGSQICICWFMFKGRQTVCVSQLLSCLNYCPDKSSDEVMAAATLTEYDNVIRRPILAEAL